MVLFYKVKQTNTILQKYVHPTSFNQLMYRYAHAQCRETKKGQQKVPTTGLCQPRCYYAMPHRKIESVVSGAPELQRIVLFTGPLHNIGHARRVGVRQRGQALPRLSAQIDGQQGAAGPPATSFFPRVVGSGAESSRRHQRHRTEQQLLQLRVLEEEVAGGA